MPVMCRCGIVIGLSLGLAACSAGGGARLSSSGGTPADGMVRAERDLQAYASASCFAMQDDPFLRCQGEKWAGGVMQRADGPLAAWRAVADAVSAELRRGGVGVGKPERVDDPTETLPVMTCGEIAGTPVVRRAIDRAIEAVAAD